MRRNRKTAILLLTMCATAACGPKRPDDARPEDHFAAIPVMPLPVGSLAGSSALLLVTGTVVFGDSVGEVADRRVALLESANAALDTALRVGAREVTWHGLPEQRRVARRNPTMSIDPDRLPTSYLISAAEQVPEPLWTQIRTMAALTGARFAVVPAAVRIAGTPGALRAEYALIAVDARTGRIVWRGRSESGAAPTAELALSRAANAAVPSALTR
jgi:hypothetical protein